MAKVLIVPFVLYLLSTSLVARLGDAWYPAGYSLVVLLVGGTTWWLLSQSPRRKELLRPHANVLPAIICGLIGIVLWIWLCNLQIEQQLFAYLPKFLRPAERVAYNPFDHLGHGLAAWSFIAVRLLGIAVVVPVMEELFWRGFLMRWLIDPDWERVPLGEYTFSSCAIVTLMFTLAHPEWIAAATYCLLMHGLWYWRKDLWLCIVAHATSNAALAAYVLLTGTWILW